VEEGEDETHGRCIPTPSKRPPTASSLTLSLYYTRDHAKQLLEKYIGKPFFNYVADGRRRMTVEDLERGIAWMQGHFHVIKHVKDDAPTIDWVLEVARLAVMR
jgi:hypothetical protein